jgi:VanZ family protein
MLFMMVVIFMFSTQNITDTMKTSDTIVTPIENQIKASSDKTFEDEKAETDYWKKIKGKLDKLVRKSAHAFNFCVLGIFTMLFFKSLGMKTEDAIMVTIALCALYAGSDELHQKLVDGRNSRFEDVCIDMFGTWIGITLTYLGGKITTLNGKKTRIMG